MTDEPDEVSAARGDDIKEVDVFISYVSADRAPAEQLVRTLEQEGLTVDVWNFSLRTKVGEMLQHARNARFRVLIVSADYLGSTPILREFLSALTANTAAGRLIVVMTKPISTPLPHPLLDLNTINLFDLDRERQAELLLAAVGNTEHDRPTSNPLPRERFRWSGTPEIPDSTYSLPSESDPEAAWRRDGEMVGAVAHHTVFGAVPSVAHPQRGPFVRAVCAAFRILRPPLQPSGRDLQVASDARWTRIETRLDRRLTRAGPPPDEHRQLPSASQPEDPR